MELIIIPIVVAVFASFAGKYSKWIALAGSLAGLVIISMKLQVFQLNDSFQFVNAKPWFGKSSYFKTGIDGISMVLLLLTNILSPIILLSSFGKSDEGKTMLPALIVGMQGALNGVFLAMDGLMFYIFWELALIPIYFICALWGEGNRFKTTLKFFIYTFVGSLAMLASLLYLYTKTEKGSFDYNDLIAVQLSTTEAIWIGAGILLAFIVKIPLFPFHSWQPDTYTEAPAQGSMLLSGIMLKMGLYGLIRWFFPITPEANHIFIPVIIALGVIGVLFGALIAIRQQDIKRIIAYSSLSHVGLIAAGIATLSLEGVQGGLLQMFNHGVNVVGLFLVADIIQKRAQSRDLGQLGGIAKQAPFLAATFLIIVLGATAVPFTNGFPGELLLLKSVFSFHAVYGIMAGLTIILCAVYMLRMYQFSMLGAEKNGIYMFNDADKREMLILVLIVFMVIGVGVFPNWINEISGPSVNKTLEIIKNSVGGLA